MLSPEGLAQEVLNAEDVCFPPVTPREPRLASVRGVILHRFVGWFKKLTYEGKPRVLTHRYVGRRLEP